LQLLTASLCEIQQPVPHGGRQDLWAMRDSFEGSQQRHARPDSAKTVSR